MSVSALLAQRETGGRNSLVQRIRHEYPNSFAEFVRLWPHGVPLAAFERVIAKRGSRTKASLLQGWKTSQRFEEEDAVALHDAFEKDGAPPQDLWALTGWALAEILEAQQLE